MLYGGEHPFFGFRAHSGEVAKLAFLCGLFELVDGINAHLFIDKLYFFWAQAFEIEHIEQCLWNRFLHIFQCLAGLRLEDLDNLAGDALADALDRFEVFAALHHELEARGEIVNSTHTAVVRANSKGTFTFDFEQVG